MRAITFNQLLTEAAYRIGALPDLTNLANGFGTHTLPQLIAYLNDAAERAWSAFPWPETINKDEKETDGEDVIPWENVDQAEWASAWLDDPDAVYRPRELSIRQVPDGLLIVPWSRAGVERIIPPTVWLLWRPKAPQFTATEHDDAVTYAAGDVVWDRSGTGECYVAAVASPSTTLSDPTQWLLQEIPLILRVPIQKFAHATHLREREKFGAAEAMDQDAVSALEDQWMRASEFEQYHLGKY